MTVHSKQLIDYIQKEVNALAADRTKTQTQSLLYTVGFLTAQLALAIESDNANLYRFRAAIRSAKMKD